MSVSRPLVLALAAASLAAAVPLSLPAQRAEGRSYFFRLQTPDEGPTEGVMHVVGDRARIDIRDAEGDDGGRVYLLLTNGGRTLVTVRPDEHRYSEVDAETIEGIIGTAMRAANIVMTMDMANSNVNGEKFGDGGTVAGLPTQRYRLTQEWEMDVGAFGKTERVRQRVVTDYWVNASAGLPRNPLVELVTTAPTALAQSDEKFVARSARTRASLFDAAPLRVVVHASKWEHDGSTEEEMYEYEITRILPASVDQRALRVPDGYRRDDDKGFDISW
jgi:hypothetical protein